MDGGRVDDVGEPDLEVLRLARRPGRCGAGVGDAGVRVEAGRVRHRHPGPEDRPLEGPAEVAVAGEPEPAALGVADPQPLDGRRLLLRLVTHDAQATAGRSRAATRLRTPPRPPPRHPRRTPARPSAARPASPRPAAAAGTPAAGSAAWTRSS